MEREANQQKIKCREMIGMRNSSIKKGIFIKLLGEKENVAGLKQKDFFVLIRIEFLH